MAVLYFENLSRDTADAYLADGLTEEIIARLGQVSRLNVTSKYEVRRVRGQSNSDPAVLGRTLNAAWLVSGSVQRGGSRVRVRVELLRASTRARVWGDQFDQPQGDVLAIEEAIGRGVVLGVTGALLPAERTSLERRPTRDPVAYDLYLRGNALINRFTEPDLRAAIVLYEQALARDSSFALAYRGVAYAWSFLADDFLAPRNAYPQAQRALEHALAIDSSAAVLGWTLPMLTLEYDVPRAERWARRALELDPNLPDANWGMVWVSWAQGRLEDAVRYARRAWQVDSLSLGGAVLLAYSFMSTRQFDSLAAFAPRASGAVPAEEVRGWEALARFGHGDCAGAVPGLRGARALGSRRWIVPALVCAGKPEEAQAFTDSLVAERQTRYLPGTTIAMAFAALGDLDRAFAWLARAVDERDAGLLWLRNGLEFDGLRSDPRFDAILRRTWLAPRPGR